MVLNGENNVILTDEELCMLEQLTYLDEIVAEKAGVNDVFSKINVADFYGSKICEILSAFDEKAIVRLMAYPESICDGDISGVEWAKIITYLKDTNHRISQLVLCDEMENGGVSNYFYEYGDEGGKGYYRAAVYNPYTCDDAEINEKYSGKYIDIGVFRQYFAQAALDATGESDIERVLNEMLWAKKDQINSVGKMVRIPLALVFTDHLEKEDNSNNDAIIVYRGTTGPNEYADDIRATYESDTTAQKGALNFANQVANRFGDITVVGHAKGGNKAMYATINCNDIVRCVCFDAQGFSKEFIDSHQENINNRAHLITNYSVETDYVHEILNQLPGARQIFTKGYGVDGMSENHASNSFFNQDNEDFYKLATYSGSELYDKFLHPITKIETSFDDGIDIFMSRIAIAEMLYNKFPNDNMSFEEYCNSQNDKEDKSYSLKSFDDYNINEIIIPGLEWIYYNHGEFFNDLIEYLDGISNQSFKSCHKYQDEIHELKKKDGNYIYYDPDILTVYTDLICAKDVTRGYEGIAFHAKIANWLCNHIIEWQHRGRYKNTDWEKKKDELENRKNKIDGLSNWCSEVITNRKVDCINTYERDHIADIFELMYNMYGEEFYNYLESHMRFNSGDGGNNPEFVYAEKEDEEISKLKGLTDYLVNASKNDETLRGFLEYIFKEGLVDENADGTVKLSKLDYILSLGADRIKKELKEKFKLEVKSDDVTVAMFEMRIKSLAGLKAYVAKENLKENRDDLVDLYNSCENDEAKLEVIGAGILRLGDTLEDFADIIDYNEGEAGVGDFIKDMAIENIVSPFVAGVLENNKEELENLIAHIVFYSKANGLSIADAVQLASSLLHHSFFDFDMITNILTAAVFSGIAIAADQIFLHGAVEKELLKDVIIDLADIKVGCDDKFITLMKKSFDDPTIKDLALFTNKNLFIDKRLDNFKNLNAKYESNFDIVAKYWINILGKDKFEVSDINSILDYLKNSPLVSKYVELDFLNEYKKRLTDILAENGYHLIIGSKYDEYLSYDHNIVRDIYFGDSDAARQINDNDDRKVVILGGSGDDTIYFNGKKVRDEIKLSQVWGGAGNDNITLGDNISGENAVVHGDSGIEDIGGDDKVYGSLGDDRIYGDGGYDFLYGRRGDDKLYGNDGNDTLSGGRGRDELYGGTGNDTYIYNRFDENGLIINSNNNDFIKDSQGNNIIHFPDIEMNDLSIDWWDKSKHDLKFTVKSLGTSLTIRNYYKTSGNFTFTFGKSKEKYYVSQTSEGKFEFKSISSGGYSGGSFGNELYSPLVGKLFDKKSLIAYEEYKKASEAQQPRDPLIINFSNDEDNNGLVGVENGVYFDLDNNGVAEKTAWIDSNKGFLAIDRDGDGKISNGGELFGDQVTLKNGQFSASGFEALAELDDNVDEVTGAIGDGVIDKNDSLFDQLRVWIDEKRNGVSEEGELKTLSELGIASISLNTENKGFVDNDTKTSITETAEVRLKNGKTLDISEHWFEVHTFDTQEININGENVSSPLVFGNLPNIENYIVSEENSDIKDLYDSFVSSNDYIEKRILTRKLLYTLSGADKIAVDSRGQNIDARELHVIETIMGVDSYVGIDGADPNVNASHILNNMYNEFEEYYFNLLNSGTEAFSYVDLLEETTDEDGNSILDTSVLDEAFEDTYMSDAKKCEIISGICSYLKLYDENNGTEYLDEFKNKYSDFADDYVRMSDIKIVFGTDDNDRYWGDNRNEIFDGRGGNDNIRGDYGDDIFIFGKGYGHDTVWDLSGNNVIKFVGLSPEELYVEYPFGTKDAVIIIEETGDSLTLSDFRSTETDRQYSLEFDNGVRMALDEDGSPFRRVKGTDKNDTINMFYGNGTVEGLDGDDIINGSGGNDIIDGGAGNDVFYGRDGNDTYIFGKGSGNDTIDDCQGKNRVRFIGLNPEDLYVTYPPLSETFDAILTIAETGETLRFKGFQYYENFRGFTLEFDGGVEMAIDDEGSPFLNISANMNGETYSVLPNSILNGKSGNETLYGSSGNDIFDGGAGNDVFYGRDGNDTYIFGKGSGNDTIDDCQGKNRVRFIGLNPEDLYVTYPPLSETFDAILTIAETGETLRFKGFQYYENFRGFTLEFDGGVEMAIDDEGSPFLNISANMNGETYSVLPNSILNGKSGNETLHGSYGNDIFDGGAGNDVFYGSDGNDTYIFGKGSGNDRIEDWNGNNRIRLVGLSPEDLYITYPISTEDAILTIAETGEKLTLRSFRDRQDFRRFTLVFDDGTEMSLDSEESPFRNTVGTDGGDNMLMYYKNGTAHGLGGNDMISGSSGADVIYGEAGNDTLYGYDGNDTIYGGDGSDKLYGGDGVDKLYGEDGNDELRGESGNDVLNGGRGNDTLLGGGGNDTYLFNIGDGSDTINEEDTESFNADRVVFGEGISISDVTVTKSGADAVLSIGTEGDRLRIVNHFCLYYRIESFEFADGTIAHIDLDTSRFVVDVEGTAVTVEQTAAEYLSGLYADDVFSGELVADSTVIAEVTDSASIGDDNSEISDITNIQAMILAENMSAFSNESQIYDHINIGDIKSDSSALDQLLVNTSMQ